MHHEDADKAYREKARRELHRNALCHTEQILEATSYKAAAVRLPIIYLLRGARGVVVIAVGNEHGDTSSNPGRYWLHFT